MDKFLIQTINNQPLYKRKLFWLIASFFILIIFIIILIVTDTDKEEIIILNDNQEFTPYICLNENMKPSKNCIGGWFYRTTDYTPEYNARFAKSKNWNYVLLSFNVNHKNITQNIKEFRKQGISVHLMTLQDTKYINNPQEAYDQIREVLIFVNVNKLDIQGIHIDAEPHAMTEWKNGDSDVRTQIFKNYTKVLENCRKAINEYRANVTFSAAVAWFYSSKTKKNEIIGGRGYDLVNRNRLDFIFPMVYSGAGDTIKDIIKHSDDYISDNSNTVIGISVKEHGENLLNIMNQVFENRKNEECFYGVAIFSNNYYSDWGNNN